MFITVWRIGGAVARISNGILRACDCPTIGPRVGNLLLKLVARLNGFRGVVSQWLTSVNRSAVEYSLYRGVEKVKYDYTSRFLNCLRYSYTRKKWKQLFDHSFGRSVCWRCANFPQFSSNVKQLSLQARPLRSARCQSCSGRGRRSPRLASPAELTHIIGHNTFPFRVGGRGKVRRTSRLIEQWAKGATYPVLFVFFCYTVQSGFGDFGKNGRLRSFLWKVFCMGTYGEKLWFRHFSIFKEENWTWNFAINFSSKQRLHL